MTSGLHLLIVGLTVTILTGCESTTKFGEPVTGDPVSVSIALDQRSIGRTMTIEGTLHDVCRDEGCWFVLSDSLSEITVRYVDEKGLGIPVIARGKARVRGIVRDTVIGRNRVPELRATGVQLLGD